MTRSMSDISIMLAGEAGAGVQSVETILIAVFKQAGFHVCATKEYMSRVRGGTNSTTIRISSMPAQNIREFPDVFLPLDQVACERYSALLCDQTIIITDGISIMDKTVHDLPMKKLAADSGSAQYASMVAAGAIAGLLGFDQGLLSQYITTRFSSKGEPVVEGNIKASEAGYGAGVKFAAGLALKVTIPVSQVVKDAIVVTGSEAVALGAIAGGCDAVFAYPMTPGTGVFTALAQWAQKAGIAVEQAEDEISAINMAIGAWYAGARAIVSTSGGGFALMTEGLSLSGMTETPVVVHLAQRPGPATGLPTRTEQGDLELALYAGHGVFARAIFAPGDLEQAYELTRHAFDVADRFQSPCIILTDQYFTDTCYDTPEFSVHPAVTKHIIETKDGYKRYDLSDPISPRGVPGYGTGRVCADSDEHDESGRITEDLPGISLSMKEKRAAKLEILAAEALPPDFYGDPEFETLYICWGSVLPIAREAMALAGAKTGLLHFTQVFPLNMSAIDYFERAMKIVVIENNQGGQFQELLESTFDVLCDDPIRRYDGSAFTVDELVARMQGGVR